MFRHIMRSFFCPVLCSLLFMSCASKRSYTYNYVAYEEPEPALAAQKADIDAILSKITPTNHPIGGSAVVILPSVSYLERNFPVVWKGVEPSQEFKEKASNFFATSTINNMRSRGQALEKRRIFDRVVIVNSDNPENASFDEEIALLLFKKDGEAQWFLSKKGRPLSTMIAIPTISTALPPVQREILWLENVEKLSQKESGK